MMKGADGNDSALAAGIAVVAATMLLVFERYTLRYDMIYQGAPGRGKKFNVSDRKSRVSTTGLILACAML